MALLVLSMKLVPNRKHNMPILVSLICPVYKVAQYIPELMQSLLAGVNTDQVEIVFVDDCCPEQSIEYCEKFIADNQHDIQFNSVIIRQLVNQGLSVSRNEGLKVAKGKYVGFIDSDDAISPHYWNTLKRYVQNPENDIIEFDFEEFSDSLPMNNERNITELPSSNLNPFYTEFFVWIRLYKKEMLENIKFPRGMIYEDMYFTMHAFSRSKKSVRISNSLVFYRKRDGSITAKRTSLYSHLLINLVLAIQQTIYNIPQKSELVSQLQKRTLLLMLKGLKISDKADRKIYYQLCFPKLIEVNMLAKQYGSDIIGKINYSLSCLICRLFK